MQKETLIKIKKLAFHLQMGDRWDNFLTRAMAVDKELGLRLHRLTIKEYEPEIMALIKYYGAAPSFEKPKPPQKVWTGLFEYRGDAAIFRTGKYEGCNIHDNPSLKKHFKDFIELYKYVISCLEPGLLLRLRGFRDPDELELNIKTLTDLKEKIEKRGQFPTTLRQIRNKKGVN